MTITIMMWKCKHILEVEANEANVQVNLSLFVVEVNELKESHVQILCMLQDLKALPSPCQWSNPNRPLQPLGTSAQ